jgi:hypothetical protein
MQRLNGRIHVRHGKLTNGRLLHCLVQKDTDKKRYERRSETESKRWKAADEPYPMNDVSGCEEKRYGTSIRVWVASID